MEDALGIWPFLSGFLWAVVLWFAITFWQSRPKKPTRKAQGTSGLYRTQEQTRPEFSSEDSFLTTTKSMMAACGQFLPRRNDLDRLLSQNRQVYMGRRRLAVRNAFEQYSAVDLA